MKLYLKIGGTVNMVWANHLLLQAVYIERL